MSYDVLEYVNALRMFDGHVDYRPGKNYEIIIADLSKEFLEGLCLELKRVGINCGVYASTRDRAFRLRIYGKEAVERILSTSVRPIVLIAAAIDAEGNVEKYKDQPFRTRIVLKNDEKAEILERALMSLNPPVRYLKTIRNGGKYVEFVISGREENTKLYSLVKIRHPLKYRKVSAYLNLNSGLQV